MIGYLSGQVQEIQGSQLIVNVGGVGYEVHCTQSVLASVLARSRSEKVELVIYTDVKEDSIRLFGFSSSLEKKVFLMLLSVKGVGARHALEIISSFAVKSLVRALAMGEAIQLQSVKGIGKKTSERIILELQDKVRQEIDESLSLASSREMRPEHNNELPTDLSAAADATMALQALGFSAKDAELAVRKAIMASPEIAEPGEIVKIALQHL